MYIHIHTCEVGKGGDPDDSDAIERRDLPGLGLVPRKLVPFALDVWLLEGEVFQLLLPEPEPPCFHNFSKRACKI